MDKIIFSKMKVKPDSKWLVVNAPDVYPAKNFESVIAKNSNYDFIHLFVENCKDFEKYFPKVSSVLANKGLLWVSYPKGSAKIKTDINRNIIWDLCIPLRFHPVAQISLDEKWSAIRMKPNEEGVVYSRPGKNKALFGVP
jgi:hypothetical protein